VTTDAECVSNITLGVVVPVVTSVVTLGTVAGVMWQMEGSLVPLVFLSIPPMVVAVRRFARPMEQRSYEQYQREGELYNVLERDLSGIAVIKAFGAEERSVRRFRDGAARVIEAALAAVRLQLAYKACIEVGSAVATAAVVWFGANLVADGRMTFGSLLVYISYLAMLYGPVQTIMYSATSLNAAAASGRRVLVVLDAVPEVVDRPGAGVLGPVRGSVVLEGVTFGYRPGEPVLRDVSLAAEPGETVALVGSSGAGKTTLVSLLIRFFDPWSGRVLVDGVDLRDVRLASLREQVAIVLQEPFLFPMSVAENIAYGRPDASREEVVAAARAANAHGFIEALPDGYDSVVGERGATLSGGERQRLAVARALLKDAPILILDEPTSSLDSDSEALLLEALERLMAGRTTFIIAHRLSTVRNADRVVVLEEGRVVESGRHRQLLARKGRYAHLHRLQTSQRAPKRQAPSPT
jgi:ATP-binding cassette subfamily B protein